MFGGRVVFVVLLRDRVGDVSARGFGDVWMIGFWWMVLIQMLGWIG